MSLISDASPKLKSLILSIFRKCYVFVDYLGLVKLPNLPPKKSARLVYIASDNNKASGAFLCMVNLCHQLINKYGMDVFVIVPPMGNGEFLLKSKNIPYAKLFSCSWVIPITEKEGKYFNKTVNNKRRINEVATKTLSKFFNQNDVDLVHLNTTYTYFGSLVALDYNIPLIWHLREFLEENQNLTLWDRNKGNSLINKSDRVITVSDSLYKKYENIIDSEKLITVYDGIIKETFYKPEHNILTSSKPIILFLGLIEMHKGPCDFIKACAKLFKKNIHDFEVWIVGDGNKQILNQMKNIIEEAGMKDIVTFFGYQNDVIDYFKKSDIFCMCSGSEAFGRTTVEAMLAGNLVIGAESAGTKDLINDGVTGLYYELNNIDDLCLKLAFALENKTKSQSIAKKGQEYMVKNMISEKNVDNIYSIYQEILD